MDAMMKMKILSIISLLFGTGSPRSIYSSNILKSYTPIEILSAFKIDVQIVLNS